PTIDKYENDVAAGYADIGLTLHKQGRLAEAESPLRKAVEIRERLVRQLPWVSDYQDDLGKSYLDLAFTEQGLGRLDAVVDLSRKAVHIRELLARQNGTDQARWNLGWCYTHLGIAQQRT